ncbi:uncharacterized protein LOC116029609 [Ipomoea triloba]|uniref:uncharacterized protein LOC116029609 n=1 Tax=Ipomoea triloba TaxID=35885 RepID=UPI00125D9532|nr:uncharacterized protein LOC116029609 [Ipomoea triloba]
MEDENFKSEYPIIRVTKAEKERLRKPWRRSLIIRVLGRTVNYTFLQQRLQRMWKPEGSFDLIAISHEYYIARFEALKDYEFAKFEGPWMILDHYLVVQEWKPNFTPWKNKTEKLLVWVRFPKLPIEYFEEDFLKKIGLSIGRPVKIDTTTSLTTKGKFARVCVELDITKPLLSRFVLNMEEWPVEYEGIHLVCFKCGKYGHRHEKCGQEEVNKDGQESHQRENDNQVTGHWGSEKYGSWMLVSRRERGNRNRVSNNQRGGPPLDRRQVPQRNNGRDGLGTQSRFAALDGLDDNGLPQHQEPMQSMALQQPEHPLPRIRMHDQNI